MKDRRMPRPPRGTKRNKKMDEESEAIATPQMNVYEQKVGANKKAEEMLKTLGILPARDALWDWRTSTHDQHIHACVDPGSTKPVKSKQMKP